MVTASPRTNQTLRKIRHWKIDISLDTPGPVFFKAMSIQRLQPDTDKHGGCALLEIGADMILALTRCTTI